MQVHNLAIVFGPTLFSASSDNEKARSHSKSEQKNKRKASAFASSSAANNSSVDVVQSNSHLAFNMIMQGQIVEYLLKEYDKFFHEDNMENVTLTSTDETAGPSGERAAILPPQGAARITSVRLSSTDR
jgi:hypothetical protein